MATTNSQGGWPDATNTGIPAGVTLTSSGNLVITKAGTVISGLDIKGTVYINAPNVTLIDCKITAASFAVVQIAQGVTGAVVQNCEINGVGTNNDGSNGISGQGTFIGNNIYNVENGINVTGSSVIQDNYIHDLKASGSPHYDGIQIDGGVSNVTISHNTIINPWGQTSAIMIDNYFGSISNITVNNNLLAGGGYTIYDDGHFNSNPITGVSITNNHIKAGQYGATNFNGTNPVYTGNINDGATLVSTLNTTANSGSSSSPTPPSAPTIASFSNDSGVAGDHITNDNTLTLTGKASPSGTITVYDGKTKLGTATADSSGTWSFSTAKMGDGSHSFTATVTKSGMTGTASSALVVTVDTVAPAAPVETGDSIVNGNQVVLNGTAEAGSAIKVYDGATQVGTTTANANGSWTVTTAALSIGNHDLTATATDAAGNRSALSAPLDPVIKGASKPSAPVIASFSNDSGVVGDHITNDNTLKLTGTAVAKSTITLYDGQTKLGNTTADSSGAWTFSTAKLTDGAHSLTATDTVAGATSVASSALSVKVDSVVPNAPVIASAKSTGHNTYDLRGTAEVGSSVAVFDGRAQIGTTTTDSKGAWSFTTTALSTGGHSFTAKATDVAGNASTPSSLFSVTVSGDKPSAVSVPTITSFSNDSGILGDKITNDSTLKLTGIAASNAMISVFDGSMQIGVTKAAADGSWNYITSVLSDAKHMLSAAASDGALHQSVHSQPLAVTIDTHAPTAPSLSVSASGHSVGATTTSNDFLLGGKAEANSTIKIFDGGSQIGSTTTKGDGTWTFDTGHVANGAHSYASKAIDAAGNNSVMSAVHKVIVIDAPSMPSHHGATIASNTNGTAIDGVTSTSFFGLSRDATAGGSSRSSDVNSTHAQGNDWFFGGHSDTFVFASNFGKNAVISDFHASGANHDVVQFNKSVFDGFAEVLTHATQAGHDVVIATGHGDSLTLKNTKVALLDKLDFHFA